MTDQGTQFDDELLSAYLDDELAPENRARVERRLAADPEARKLLDELRAVSQATKELPPEKLDGDIRDTILRRAERAMLLSPSSKNMGEPASAGDERVQRRDQPSRFTIGRSPRGWMWAGLAVAAALMLMVYQSEPEQNDKLPAAVAARSDESRESIVEPTDRMELRALSRELSAVEEVAPPLAEAETARTEPPPSAGYELAISAPASAAAQPTGDVSKGLAELRDDAPTTTGEALALGKSAAESTAPAPVAGRVSGSGRAGSVGGAFPERSLAEGIAAESDAAEAELLVVHLQCKPEALQRKVLDDTLLKNNITIEEPETPRDESVEHSVRSDREMAGGVRFQSRSSWERAAEPARVERPSFDAVLVKAETAQFKKVMEEIDADDENFLGVVVEEPPAAAKKALADVKNGVDWQQFSRGRVSQRGKLEQRAGNYFYYTIDREPIFLGRTDTGDGSTPQRQTIAKDFASGPEGGRAPRQQMLSRLEQQSAATDTAGPAEEEHVPEFPAGGAKWGLARRGVATWPKAKANLLQVLFVLQADDRAATSAATEQSQVLQNEDR